MSYLEAIILGMVQGISEFLPISSSGHLVIFEKFFALPGDHIGFNVAVHLGTLLSVVTVYRRTLWQLIKEALRALKEKRQNSGTALISYVVIASIPTGFMGVFLRDFWEKMFSSLFAVGVCLCLTGGLLFLTRRISSEQGAFGDQLPSQLGRINWWKALLIGIAQGMAIAPGISRSGTTIAAGLLLGLDRHIAALFSFLLMIVAVGGATFLEFSHFTWTMESAQIMASGLVFAYISGVIGLSFILKVVKNGRLEFFTPYLLVVGGVTMIYAISQ